MPVATRFERPGPLAKSTALRLALPCPAGPLLGLWSGGDRLLDSTLPTQDLLVLASACIGHRMRQEEAQEELYSGGLSGGGGLSSLKSQLAL